MLFARVLYGPLISRDSAVDIKILSCYLGAELVITQEAYQIAHILGLNKAFNKTGLTCPVNILLPCDAVTGLVKTMQETHAISPHSARANGVYIDTVHA